MTFNSSSDPGTGRDAAGIGSDDEGTGIARTWMLIVGVALLAAGLLGFVDNPIVSQREDALFHVDTLHNVIHILTGLIALFIGASLRGRALAQATIAFGVAYLLVLGRDAHLARPVRPVRDAGEHRRPRAAPRAVGWQHRRRTGLEPGSRHRLTPATAACTRVPCPGAGAPPASSRQ